ncbi:MAG: hypothetical protein M0Z40_07855, partial [Actinomycetota bacterium]|nr:hypothetical protein [Actinomycetota bacterium]
MIERPMAVWANGWTTAAGTDGSGRGRQRARAAAGTGGATFDAELTPYLVPTELVDCGRPRSPLTGPSRRGPLTHGRL